MPSLKQTLSLICITAALGMVSPYTVAQDLIPPKSAENGDLKPAGSGTYPELRLTPDKPEIVTLDQDIANIIVGNSDHLAVTPDSARRIVLIPRQPGATYLRVIAEDGSTIMERYVVIGAPKKRDNYVRIRRACDAGDDSCQEYSMYYCPDMCHKLGIVDESSDDVNQATEAAPSRLPEDLSPPDGPSENSLNNSPQALPPLEPADGPTPDLAFKAIM